MLSAQSQVMEMLPRERSAGRRSAEICSSQLRVFKLATLSVGQPEQSEWACIYCCLPHVQYSAAAFMTAIKRCPDVPLEVLPH